jgi:signal transduction histidine kinase
MRSTKNYIVYVFIIIATIYNSIAGGYSVDVTEIQINGKSIKNYDNIVIAETDTIIFKYTLNTTSKATDPFLYKLNLTINEEISERTAGLKEILYCNLAQGKYIFDVSAFDLSGKWVTANSVINFEVNNEIAYLISKIDTLETSKSYYDSTINALQENINVDKSWNELSKIIIYILVGIATIFLILFIISLIKGKKNTITINSLNATSEENITQILALQAQLNKSCDIEEVEKLKNKIDAINKRLENISELNDSFNNDVNAVQSKVNELSQLQNKKNGVFKEIVKGISNPTNTIKGLVELLRSYDFNAMETNDIVANIIDYSHKIIDNAESIQRLAEFEDDGIKLNLDSVDITYVIDTAINKNIIDANKKNIEIKTNIASDIEKIQADQQKLIVVMHNLINNAVKFTNDNGKINIDVYEKNDSVHFEVNDNGIGIDQADLQKLYRNLSENHDADVTIGPDSTIGLLTVKKYVEAHNGRVMVSSITNKGSTFSFNIPLKRY